MGRLPSSAGMGPVNWLLRRYNRSSSLRLPSSPGISPVNSFQERSRTLRLESLPTSSGISPLNHVPSASWPCSPRRFSSSRLERLPSSTGISPLSLLKDKSSSTRLDRLPISLGISPLSPLPLRLRAVTQPLLSVSTPYHLRSGCSLNQFLYRRQFAPSNV